MSNYVTIPIGANSGEDGKLNCRKAENSRGKDVGKDGHHATLDVRPDCHAIESTTCKEHSDDVICVSSVVELAESDFR